MRKSRGNLGGLIALVAMALGAIGPVTASFAATDARYAEAGGIPDPATDREVPVRAGSTLSPLTRRARSDLGEAVRATHIGEEVGDELSARIAPAPPA